MKNNNSPNLHVKHSTYYMTLQLEMALIKINSIYRRSFCQHWRCQSVFSQKYNLKKTGPKADMLTYHFLGGGLSCEGDARLKWWWWLETY